MSVAAVAKKMGRAESTVHGYLGDFLRHDKVVDASPWVDAATIARVEQAADSADDQQRLKPIFEALDGQVAYHDIRVVVSCLRMRQELGEAESDAELDSE